MKRRDFFRNTVPVLLPSLVHGMSLPRVGQFAISPGSQHAEGRRAASSS